MKKHCRIIALHHCRIIPAKKSVFASPPDIVTQVLREKSPF